MTALARIVEERERADWWKLRPAPKPLTEAEFDALGRELRAAWVREKSREGDRISKGQIHRIRTTNGAPGRTRQPEDPMTLTTAIQLQALAWRLLTTTDDGQRADRIPSRNDVVREMQTLRRVFGR